MSTPLIMSCFVYNHPVIKFPTKWLTKVQINRFQLQWTNSHTNAICISITDCRVYEHFWHFASHHTTNFIDILTYYCFKVQMWWIIHWNPMCSHCRQLQSTVSTVTLPVKLKLWDISRICSREIARTLICFVVPIAVCCVLWLTRARTQLCWLSNPLACARASRPCITRFILCSSWEKRI